MVLTNFESWAHGGSQPNNDNIGAVGGRRNHDLFNLSVIQACHATGATNDLIQYNNNDMTTTVNEEQQQTLPPPPPATNNSINISHISSNGYYGFSQICHQQNDENAAKKLAMEDDDCNNMMDIDLIGCAGGGPTRKRLHESNIYETKRCRFDDNDSQFDDFCQSSFAPNSITDLTMDQQNPLLQQQHSSAEQHSFMITNNNNLQSDLQSTIYKRKLLMEYVVSNNNNNINNNNISYEPNLKLNNQNLDIINNNRNDNKITDKLQINQNNINNNNNSNLNNVELLNNCKTDDDNDKLLMENLYFNIHGGGDYQMWLHLNNQLDDDI